MRKASSTPKDAIINIRVPKTLYDEIHTLSEKHDLSVSHLSRKAIKIYLEELQKNGYKTLQSN
jgi:predicted DNA-binding protein